MSILDPEYNNITEKDAEITKLKQEVVKWSPTTVYQKLAEICRILHHITTSTSYINAHTL